MFVGGGGALIASVAGAAFADPTTGGNGTPGSGIPEVTCPDPGDGMDDGTLIDCANAHTNAAGVAGTGAAAAGGGAVWAASAAGVEALGGAAVAGTVSGGLALLGLLLVGVALGHLSDSGSYLNQAEGGGDGSDGGGGDEGDGASELVIFVGPDSFPAGGFGLSALAVGMLDLDDIGAEDRDLILTALTSADRELDALGEAVRGRMKLDLASDDELADSASELDLQWYKFLVAHEARRVAREKLDQRIDVLFASDEVASFREFLPGKGHGVAHGVAGARGSYTAGLQAAIDTERVTLETKFEATGLTTTLFDPAYEAAGDVSFVRLLEWRDELRRMAGCFDRIFAYEFALFGDKVRFEAVVS